MRPFGLSVAVCLLAAAASSAATPCAPSPNPIVAENAKPGNPASEWDLASRDNGAAEVQGFASPISINRGGTVTFKLRIAAAQYPVSYTIDLYRMGYYGGLGARKVKSISGVKPAAEPVCAFDEKTGLVDCSSWTGPTWNGIETGGAVAPSGVYIAKLSSPGIGESHMIFVIRDDGGCADLLFQTSDTTWQAYNVFSDGRGPISLYANPFWQSTVPAQQGAVGFVPARAYKVSYERPFNSRGPSSENGEHSWFFNAEYPMVRWLEANGYNVSYVTGVDTDRDGAELLQHKVFLSVGHDEYWSGDQRAHVEAARNAGVHLAFFAGNEVYWKTRWENDRRTMVCYKETHADAKIDPLPDVWTGTWRDPRFSPPADGARPENALHGNIFTTNVLGYGPPPTMSVTREDGALRLWRDTPVRNLQPGDPPYDLPAGTLGYEYDTDLDNGVRPAGLVRLATSPGAPGLLLMDYGDDYVGGYLPHHVTLYRHGNGALVFGAGTIQWSWGLDCHHDRGDDCALYCSSAAERQRFLALRQATVNLFADMGVFAATLQNGLVAASQSTDTTAPASIIVSPAANATVVRGASVTVAGTASDSGGAVAGVEFSDDATRWHPANGRASWSYAWTAPLLTGASQLRSRATDDSANQQPAGAGTTVYVAHAVPGEIQAEDFDRGGEGIGYHDTTAGNSGTSAYRTGESVDLTQCPANTQCNVIVGYVQPSEWLQYTIDVDQNGTYSFAVRGTNGAGGTFRIEVDGVDRTGSIPVPDTGDNWIVGTSWKSGIALTAGRHTMRLVMLQNGAHGWIGNFDSIRISRAYGGVPAAIPGAFEVEHFDDGGEGVAYHDTTAGNSGTSTERPGTDVDLTACPAATQCSAIAGYVKAGEWLLYSVDVAATATYDIIVEGTNGSAGAAFHIEVDGVDETGALSIPATGGDNWVVGTARKNGVALSAGPRVLRIVMDAEGPGGWVGNFDAVRIIRRPFAVPGPAIEAEDFDEGGYSDTTAGNAGSGVYYRASDVDLTVCPSGTDCRVIVGYVKAGEWLQYTVNVAASGTYAIAVRGTNGSIGGAFHVEIDGVDRTRPLAVPDTGSNWVAGTVTSPSFTLGAGTHLVRIVMDHEAAHSWVGNFDSLRFVQP